MKKKLVISIAAVFFVTLVITLSMSFMFEETLPYEGHLPENIGAYTMLDSLEGNEAKEYINRALNKELNVEEAHVLYYETYSGSYAIVKISVSPDETALTSILDEKYNMLQENPQFTPMEAKVISDTEINMSLAEETNHYFYISGDRYVWIETFEDTRDRFIRNAVTIF